jgi:hypothetical protein
MGSAKMNKWILLASLAVLSACTTMEEIRRPDGSTEYLIACGAGTGWNICYNRANEVCPTGYEILAENAGFNRKELRISCPGKTENE